MPIPFVCDLLTGYRHSPRIEVNDLLNGATADGAKLFAAREHYAINFRAIEAFCFVHRAFKRADLVQILLFGKKLNFKIPSLAEQRLHLLFRAIFGAKAGATPLSLKRILI